MEFRLILGRCGEWNRIKLFMSPQSGLGEESRTHELLAACPMLTHGVIFWAPYGLEIRDERDWFPYWLPYWLPLRHSLETERATPGGRPLLDRRFDYRPAAPPGRDRGGSY